MKYSSLRKTHPKFFYHSCKTERAGKDLRVSFEFSIPPGISFSPALIIRDIPVKRVKEIGKEILNNLVFNLGLVEMISYWKATCSPEIVVEAGPLDQKQKAWFKNLILKGMGEYFYKNKINFTSPNFLKIASLTTSLTPLSYPHLNGVKENQQRTLVPVGGGKDGAVTLELLKETNIKLRPFLLNPKKEQRDVLEAAGIKNPVIVERTIDPKLLELNRKGYLNGHTPFSAYLAFLTTLAAALFGYKYIALSNEESSNEGNLRYLGKTINHQYSKTYEFEENFREYCEIYLSPDIEYFSFLRPLSELQIAKIFARYPQYFPAFLSCNTAHKTYSGTKHPERTWCKTCPKCLFVFAILYPFVPSQTLVETFGGNLFENPALIPLMQELTGEKRFKPFECVGTAKESIAAFFLSAKKAEREDGELPGLLVYFKKRILPRRKNIAKTAARILSSWNRRHFLPAQFEDILKKHAQS